MAEHDLMFVDAEGNEVEETSPNVARQLSGKDAEAARRKLRRAQEAEDEAKAQQSADTKQRSAPPENKGR